MIEELDAWRDLLEGVNETPERITADIMAEGVIAAEMERLVEGT